MEIGQTNSAGESMSHEETRATQCHPERSRRTDPSRGFTSGETWWDPSVSSRARWRRGQWDSEPDRVRWIDAMSGRICLAERHPRNGHWCGYVAVESDHPWYGLGEELLEGWLAVHGGITLAGTLDHRPGSRKAGRKSGPGTSGPLWWFGFHCGHPWDRSPSEAGDTEADEAQTDPPDGYRTLDYVRSECERLAEELERVAEANNRRA